MCVLVYKNRRCDMIVHQPKDSRILTATCPITVLNNEVHTITEAVKENEKQNVKLFIKHDNRPNLLKKSEQITIN